jgi:hypothetical protein
MDTDEEDTHELVGEQDMTMYEGAFVGDDSGEAATDLVSVGT